MCLSISAGVLRCYSHYQSTVVGPWSQDTHLVDATIRASFVAGPSSAPNGPLLGQSAPASPLARLNLSASADQDTVSKICMKSILKIALYDRLL